MTDNSVPDLSIVIVNYNTRKLLLECLGSIYQKTHEIALECIVVDNASADGSVSAVEEHYPQVHVIANTVGRYFSAGNNQGIKIAHGRYVFALNPDTLVLGNTLTQLVRQLDANPDIGAATTIQYSPEMQIHLNGSRQVTFGYLIFQYTFLGKIFPGKLRAYRDWLWYKGWDRTTEHDVGVLPGSCIIAPRAVWETVHGFDERLPIYFTEDHFSQAVQKLHTRTVHLVTDGIIHYEGAATMEKQRRVYKARYLNMYLLGLLTYTGLIFGRLPTVLLAIMLIPTWIVQRARAS
jgi:GT2 family glycosyltransferase